MSFWHSRPKPTRLREHFDLILEALGVIIANQEVIMTAQDNANVALAGLGDAIGKLDNAVQEGVAELLAAKNSGNDAAFQAIADKLTAFSADVNARAQALTDAESPAAPAPAPAPAPEPAPAPAPAPEPAPAPAPAPAPDAPAPDAAPAPAAAPADPAPAPAAPDKPVG